MKSAFYYLIATVALALSSIGAKAEVDPNFYIFICFWHY